MKRPLALFDVDKTIFDGFSYFPLVESQIKDGLVGTEVLRNASNCMQRYTDGQLQYEKLVRSLLDLYAAGLEGKPVDEVTESTENFFSNTDGFFDYVQPTVNMLRDTHELVIVTGGTQFSAAAVGKVLGIDTTLSSMMAINNSHLTGEMALYLATSKDKHDAVHQLTDVHPFVGSIGFGDSEGDIEILRAVDNAVCIQPTPGLRELALKEFWTIVDSPDELSSPVGLCAVKQTLEIK